MKNMEPDARRTGKLEGPERGLALAHRGTALTMGSRVLPAVGPQARHEAVDDFCVLRMDPDDKSGLPDKPERLEKLIVRNLRKALGIGLEEGKLKAAGTRAGQRLDLVQPASFPNRGQQGHIHSRLRVHPFPLAQKSFQVVHWRAGIEGHFDDRGYASGGRGARARGDSLMGVAHAVNVGIDDTGEDPASISLEEPLGCRAALSFPEIDDAPVLNANLTPEPAASRWNDIPPDNEICLHAFAS